MEDLKIKILSRLKGLEPRKLIYPSISGLFILLSLILFVLSANFVSRHVNRALDGDVTAGDILSLNKNDFEPIKNKLNIRITKAVSGEPGAPAEISPSPAPESPAIETPASETAASSTPAPEIVAVTTEEKAALKISILNSTKTSGLAAELKKVLEEKGFGVEKTGNYSPTISGTIIRIKTGKEKFKEMVAEAVSQKYPVSGYEEIPESDPYDIVVIIGK